MQRLDATTVRACMSPRPIWSRRAQLHAFLSSTIHWTSATRTRCLWFEPNRIGPMASRHPLPPPMVFWRGKTGTALSPARNSGSVSAAHASVRLLLRGTIDYIVHFPLVFRASKEVLWGGYHGNQRRSRVQHVATFFLRVLPFHSMMDGG